MRINLFEDTIDGEVQDGTVDLDQELRNTLKEITPIYALFINNNDICNGIYKRPRVDGNSMNNSAALPEFMVEFRADIDMDGAAFVIKDTIAVDFYTAYIKVLHDKAPQLFAFPKETLEKWNVKVGDISLFTNEAVINIYHYYPTDVVNRINTPVDLYTFLFDEGAMKSKLTLPFEPKFEDDVLGDYLRLIKKLKFLVNRTVKGVFKNVPYTLPQPNISIYLKKRKYVVDTGIIYSDWEPEVVFSGGKVYYNDKEYTLYKPYAFDTLSVRASKEITQYFIELGEHLAKFYNSYNVKFRLLLDKYEEGEN